MVGGGAKRIDFGAVTVWLWSLARTFWGPVASFDGKTDPVSAFNLYFQFLLTYNKLFSTSPENWNYMNQNQNLSLRNYQFVCIFFVDTNINLSVNIIKKLLKCCFMSYFNVLMKSASLLMDTNNARALFIHLLLAFFFTSVCLDFCFNWIGWQHYNGLIKGLWGKKKPQNSSCSPCSSLSSISSSDMLVFDQSDGISESCVFVDWSWFERIISLEQRCVTWSFPVIAQHGTVAAGLRSSVVFAVVLLGEVRTSLSQFAF